MLIFPQLSGTSIAQFPIRKRSEKRTVVNRMPDGSSIRLADPGYDFLEWRLEYSGLTDGELAALQNFFVSTEGRLRSFMFVDPTANLLAGTRDFNNERWLFDPLLAVQGGVTDPNGRAEGWILSNRGSAEQSLNQTISAPGSYLYCFSAFLRSDEPAVIRLMAGASWAEYSVGRNWQRYWVTGRGTDTQDSVRFGIAVPNGCSICVFGLQAEAQAAPSLYRDNSGAGVYPQARFRSDEFRFTSFGPNQHSCTVEITHANHI